jgi:hypothetical protein
MAPRVGAKARSVITYEAIPNSDQMIASYQQYPANDCTMLTQTAAGGGKAEVAVEVDVPNAKQLPEGRVRVFKRSAKTPDRLEVLSEDQLRANGGVARVRLATHTELVGERKTTCTVDERARTMTEKVEVKVENKGKQAVDVVVREFMWRFSVWRVDAADESVKGQAGGNQTKEYRLSVPAGGKKSVTYTVVYHGW